MRWSLRHQSPGLIAGCRREEPALDTFDGSDCTLRLDDRAGRSARLKVCADDGVLAFTVLAEGLPDAGAGAAHPEWQNRAHLRVAIDPGHDHATRWTYGVDDRGRVIRAAHFAAPGEEAGDDKAAELDAPPGAEGEFRDLGAGRFAARLRVPAGDLWRHPGTPVGLSVGVGFHEACIPGPLAWPQPVSWTGDTPLTYGDLYRHTPTLRVDEIDIPEPTWGGDPSSLTFCGTLSEGAPRSGRVRIEVHLPGDSEGRQPDVPWMAEARRLKVRVPVVFPHRAKWANGILSVARLRVTLLDEGDRALWSAAYPFGFDAGIIVRERFGAKDGAPPPRPAPSDPDFTDAFRGYVLSRLPDYRLRTTRDGAASDFYLGDPAGKADLDLSAPDALDRAAAMLADRFPDWQDALCAAAMWVHHPMVTRHSSTWSRVSNIASVDTIPRLAGCFCGDTTRLTASLAEKIGDRLGAGLEGYSMGLRGHLATLVETPLGGVVIDGMLGLWFHTLDNTRLATLDEMRACREIAERVWYSPRAHGHEFFYGTYNQLIRRWKDGPLRWPERGV